MVPGSLEKIWWSDLIRITPQIQQIGAICEEMILVQDGECFSKKLKQETHVIMLMSKILPYAKEMRRFL